jgi:hypothetical protein
MEINLNENVNLKLALTYARKGWHVFPVHSIRNGVCSCGDSECERPGKHPRTKHGLNDASKDEKQVSQWWQETPDANIGIRTGEISGISVLDIDPRHGGFESIKAFSVPDTLVSKTGGNGQHHIFKYDEKIPNVVGFKPGLDFRSNGGYIVAPPSNHISGNEYLWADLSVEPVPAPDWMKTKGQKKPAVQSVNGTIQEGGRNDTLLSLAGTMRRRGFSEEAIVQALKVENKEKCNPPLDEGEVLNIARSVSRYEPEIEQQENKSSLLSTEQLGQIKSRIGSIPKDTDPTDLPTILNPILEEIAKIDIAQGDAVLNNTIKDHFGWKIGELTTYGKVLKSFRKEVNNEPGQITLDRDALIKKLQEAKDIKTVHPAQDYTEGGIIFCVKAQNSLCLVTSDKDIFELDDAPSKGFSLIQETVSTARFSPKGLTTFLEDKYIIDIGRLYQRIRDYIRRFIFFPDDRYLAFLSLWVMGTYVFKVFSHFPYVWLNAEKGSGKTLLMIILSKIVFNGDLTLSPTESVIFRDIANNLTTMFIDEVEQLRKQDKAIHSILISILNAGFQRDGSVKRTESDGDGGFWVKSYNVYSPKMFAGIAEIDDVLQDRTFRIQLFKKKDNEKVERYKETNEIMELQQNIRDDLYVFALTNGKAIAERYNKEGAIKGLDHLSNRELDIWEPIFLLANLVDLQTGVFNLTNIMETLSKESFEEKQAESVMQNDTYKVLTVLKTMLDDPCVIITSQDGDIRAYENSVVLRYFQNTEEFRWMQSPNALPRLLRRINIHSDQRRFGSERRHRVYLINLKEFEDWCERFKI